MFRDSKILLCLLAAAVLTLGACDAPRDAPPQPGEEVAFDVIGRGRNAQLQDTTLLRISSPERWQAYADSLTPLGSLQEVDLDRRDVILLALPVTTAGYDLRVDEVQRVDQRLIVRYTVEEPGEDCLTGQVLLTPFIAVAVEKGDASPEHDRRRERYNCSLRER